jgi:hypothetical protein
MPRSRMGARKAVSIRQRRPDAELLTRPGLEQAGKVAAGGVAYFHAICPACSPARRASSAGGRKRRGKPRFGHRARHSPNGRTLRVLDQYGAAASGDFAAARRPSRPMPLKIIAMLLRP